MMDFGALSASPVVTRAGENRDRTGHALTN